MQFVLPALKVALHCDAPAGHDVQTQDSQRAATSLDQAGVSTSTQMTVNMRSDLGGEKNDSLQAQCGLNAAQQQASLLKVLCPTSPPESQLGMVPPTNKCTSLL